jgi:4-hydroxy-3-methylbut-2-enyl diphosphate reductase
MDIQSAPNDPTSPERVLITGKARPEIRVLLASPRGFCAGVRRAIDAVRDALTIHGAPVYVRRAIVHNLEVVRSLEAEGAVFVDELEEVPRGAVVIFSAHGVPPAVAADAQQRGLRAYDAVCPLVAKVHREVERHERVGRELILIGHKGHPEIEGTLGHAGRAFVVQSVQEVAELPVGRDAPAAYAVQTTYSVDDAREIIEALRAKFSDLAEPATSDICYATTNRQNAVREIAARSDAVIVAGESFSSNANRLAEVAGASCQSVQRVAGAPEINWSKLPRGGVIGVTAAASTPETTVQEILQALSVRYRVIIEELETMRETTVFKRLAIT